MPLRPNAARPANGPHRRLLLVQDVHRVHGHVASTRHTPLLSEGVSASVTPDTRVRHHPHRARPAGKPRRDLRPQRGIQTVQLQRLQLAQQNVGHYPDAGVCNHRVTNASPPCHQHRHRATHHSHPIGGRAHEAGWRVHPEPKRARSPPGTFPEPSLNPHSTLGEPSRNLP